MTDVSIFFLVFIFNFPISLLLYCKTFVYSHFHSGCVLLWYWKHSIAVDESCSAVRLLQHSKCFQLFFRVRSCTPQTELEWAQTEYYMKQTGELLYNSPAFQIHFRSECFHCRLAERVFVGKAIWTHTQTHYQSAHPIESRIGNFC